MSFLTAQTEEDFNRAKNKAFFNEIQHFLSPEEASLISLNDVKQMLKPTNETYIGMKVIPIEKIVGSEGRYNDFDNRFFPKSSHLKNRWEHVDQAAIESIDLPPIKVYEIAGLYFVRDGNHRVSVAKARGTEFIDAEVVSLQSEITLKKPDNINDIIRQIINYEKRVFYSETGFGDITDYWCLDFSRTGRYDVIYNHILTHKYFINQNKAEEVTMEEAILSWFNNVYLPLAINIRKKHILRSFPKRTIGDLYVWIVRYWNDLKMKFGNDIPIDQAITKFKKTYKIPFYKRFLNRIKSIILRKAMNNANPDSEVL
ncbi:MAG: transcriptional regulator [Treponema sp.]|nr:transcriptional regulator [Treponema sp.]MCI7567568.1 transcriptional regulator [Treponema sp.]